MSDCIVETVAEKRVDSKRINAKTITDEEFFYGHKACAGCGGSIATRLVMKVLGKRTFTVVPAGCMSAVGFMYPQLCFANNAMISTFAGTASMMSGISAGAKALGLKNFHVVGISGDGGTADIGLQALSGAIDRRDRVIYVCYDNEAYMNTGIQKSSLTPFGARTTTTPAGKNIRGSQTRKKNMFEIVAAHGIDYAATASVGYIQDFLDKINKAKSVEGTSYIHVFAPCPTGWGTPADSAIDIGKEVVDCGLWYLAEYENGEFVLNRNPKEFTSVKDYLSRQGRFRHLNEEDIEQIIRERDKKWGIIRKSWRID
ncbi:MAG TPA: thiamine pyrophosphate-dependent enzyme [Methanotrichaceae archaeon]|nr:thiamine pyrophosphate-dependent enzyme [Methanotrichaceae archaeon]